LPEPRLGRLAEGWPDLAGADPENGFEAGCGAGGELHELWSPVELNRPAAGFGAGPNWLELTSGLVDAGPPEVEDGRPGFGLEPGGKALPKGMR
jgi:hypothetical protein